MIYTEFHTIREVYLHLDLGYLWRCHFIQKLEDQPLIENTCMHIAYEGMRGELPDKRKFEVWKSGKTGFPFIDACMRYLIYHGWITFRMRAMLTSFASYDLWID